MPRLLISPHYPLGDSLGYHKPSSPPKALWTSWTRCIARRYQQHRRARQM